MASTGYDKQESKAVHSTTQKSSYFSDLVFLAILFTVFYLLWLGSYPLFVPDEGRYSEVAREMVASGDYITPRVNGVAFLDKPALYYWLQAIAINLYGVKEWALRLFPALFGVLGCLLTYIAGRELFNRRTGVLSAIIMATTPLYFANAHYANLDLEVGVLVSGTLIFFVLGAMSNKKHYFYLAYFFAALAFLTKGLIGIAFPCMIGGAWMLITKRLSLMKHMHLGRGLLLFLTITLPWYVLVQKANPEFLHFFFVTQQVTRFLSTTEFNNPTPIWFYAPVVIIGFFPWTVFLLQALYQSTKQVYSKWRSPLADKNLYLLLWASIVFAFFSVPHSKMLGYILPIFPALALLVGHYMVSAFAESKRWRHYVAIALFVVMSFSVAALLLIVNIEQWIDISGHFAPYLAVIAGTFILGAFVATMTLPRRSAFALFFVCVLCNVIFLLTLVRGASYLNQNTAKPLISTLQPALTADDEVVHYYKFYQDVPLYLGRTVTLVADWQAPDIAYKDNWVRELWYGMPFQKTDQWLIGESAFWDRFNGEKRVFVLLNENYFSQFKAKHTKPYYVWQKHNDIILVSNRAK